MCTVRKRGPSVCIGIYIFIYIFSVGLRSRRDSFFSLSPLLHLSLIDKRQFWLTSNVRAHVLNHNSDIDDESQEEHCFNFLWIQWMKLGHANRTDAGPVSCRSEREYASLFPPRPVS